MATENSQIIIPNAQEPTKPLTMITIHNSIKLTPTNYLSWKTQMEAILIGYDLQKFIDGSHPAPPTTITTNNVVSTNPAYQTWLRQDKLLFGALVGTLSSTLVPLITQSKTSYEAWQILANTYARPSRGHIKQLKDHLKNITKGSQSITDYMQSIKTRADELAALELSLRNKISPSPLPASAHATNVRFTPWSVTNRTPRLPGSTSAPTQGIIRNSPTNTRDNRSPARPFLGRCQWCSTQGHVVSRCPLFRQQFPQVQPPSRPGNSSQSRPPAPWQAQANVTTTIPPNTTWLLDSGASHHVTTDLHNLALHSPFDGTDEIMIGDGSGLPISHTGSTSLTTPSHSFTLSNVLCVPTMKRNLISISQFCKSNNTSIEFLPSSFHVKDLHTGAILLQGRTKDGVYEWPLSTTQSRPLIAFSSVKTTLSEWHHRLGHPSLSIFKNIMSSFHLDVSRPSNFNFNFYSTDNFKYYVIFVDHFTKYIWLYPLKRKSDTHDVFVRFKALVEKFFNRPIITLYSDNGGEYQALSSFLTINGVSHLTSPPHTPEHNGYSERRHRHIVETGLSLLTHASMPLSYWPFAFSTAVYLINRLPTPTLNHLSPYFKLFGTFPNYSKLRSFGCLCYPWLRPYTSHKLESRSSPCVFVGYSPTQSAYLCLDTSTARLYTSRHVRFVESIFPFVTSHTSLPRATSSTISEWCSITLPVVATPSVNVGSAPPSSLLTPTAPSQSQDPSQNNTTCATPTPEPDSHSSAPVPETKCDCANNPPLPPTQNDPNQPPDLSPSPHVIVTRSKHNIHKPIQKLNLTAQLQQPTLEPTTVTQALKDPKWRQAMSAEFDALLRNGTWDLVPSHPTQNLVGCKWIFRTKYLPNGSIDRYKARLVAKGFHQRPGIDYSETFSPVIKPTTVRLVLSLAVSQGWSLRQLDVNNAFLQGTLTEDVFMSQPPGFIDRIILIMSASYARLSMASNKPHVPVYVDDIIITGNNVEAAQTFIQQLSQRFSLKDLGPLTYFLGVEVTSHTNGLFLSQRKYIADLLNRTHMTEAKPAPTPLATSPILTLQSGTPLSDPTEYRTVVGSLQYLSLTRPDIAYTVNKLSQFMHQPTSDHWNAVKRLLRYLCGTLDHGITLRRTSPLALHAFSDSDWAGNKDDFTSTSAYIIYLGHNPISWSSKKQRTVARSSTEAEYRSVASTAAEIRWICSLLTELGVTLPQQPVIYCDNVGATNLCSNPVFHSRMKHVALDYHFIREQVQNGLLRVSHISASDQLADALTKPLARPQFDSLKAKIGLAPRPSILRGHDKDIQSS
ncbi:Retrovirus-related Pol polyprotein from transposon RE1 [Vitis vinifera]|uniref:Retrovirus-related Pol polyprotein from transposon RE1 n=1 Tax=Vitis vinifera TaxID=29760 RepID=A0A438J6C1_VITVI|nr:Retrovirus-related Pol polyprotein from transposon RE1 [Vitis vinifera]